MSLAAWSILAGFFLVHWLLFKLLPATKMAGRLTAVSLFQNAIVPFFVCVAIYRRSAVWLIAIVAFEQYFNYAALLKVGASNRWAAFGTIVAFLVMGALSLAVMHFVNMYR